MKKLIYICLLFCVSFLSACDEDDLKPSYADEERLEGLLDLSKPLVKEYKEKYGVNILYNFDDTLDFKFGFYTSSANKLWGNLTICHLDSMEVVDYALEKLDETVFSYFKDEFKKHLPYKILLSDIVVMNTTTTIDALMGESDVEETGTVNVIANDFSYMFAFNMESMEIFNATKLKALRDVKLYHLISYVFNKEDLYAKIPESFYSGVNHLHGENVDSVAMMEDELPVGIGPYARYYTPEWYMGLGMALTKKSPCKSSAGYRQRLSITMSKTFPDRKRDFRNFVSVMIFTSESDLKTYYLPSELFCRRMRIAMQVLEAVGVDVMRINPALKMFNE